MNREIAELFMYGGLDENSILSRLGEIFEIIETGDYNKSKVVRDIKEQLKRLLVLATDYGFDKNLWHNYITFFLMMSENPFSLVCEKSVISEGTVTTIVKDDFARIRKLFFYDFSEVENKLGVNCFSILNNYQAVKKNKKIYNWNVSEKVQALSEQLEKAKDEDSFYKAVTDFYRDYGVGLFGLNKAFRIAENASGGIDFIAINNMDVVTLDDLVGYEIQKKKLTENTEAFVSGSKANNVLLFGDSGTGKSTSVKAIINQYYDRGLRMIEIYKHQFKYLSTIISSIKNRNYKFIIYMDDLSFEENEIEYKYLKAVIEGGVETRPDNILIYATSNRRHLIKETWNDKDDHTNSDDIHHSDTVEEKLSLVNRFGITIGFSKPMPKEYENIVVTLADRAGIHMDEEALRKEAMRWEMSHGGISGRTAQQFINYLVYQQKKEL
ncbi:MAG: ATP-binding protein [Lachnospiraceae bacterium]|nr:ATP-binding protein [Lachnospiraceae bacterium]